VAKPAKPAPGAASSIPDAQHQALQLRLPKGELPAPATYPQYLAYCMEMQRRYIAEERKRIAKLRKAWDRYTKAAHALNLHPLDRREIEEREDQLRAMQARITETHGDTPGQRALWDARQTEGK
jgi:hypothetical protein